MDPLRNGVFCSSSWSEKFLKRLRFFKINQHGFKEGDNVIGVYPKERELKRMCRLFGLLPLNKRLYVMLTESLIAENLFKYFNEITMTFDSVTLQTKLHFNTQKQAHNLFSQFLTVITNTDFAKWNSNMRNEETLRIFQDMDTLFRWLAAISRTH